MKSELKHASINRRSAVRKQTPSWVTLRKDQMERKPGQSQRAERPKRRIILNNAIEAKNCQKRLTTESIEPVPTRSALKKARANPK